MKYILLIHSISIGLLAVSVHVYSQKDSASINKKQGRYRLLLEDVAKVKTNSDTAPAMRTVKVARFFVKKNIYPTSDVVEIIYALNPHLDSSESTSKRPLKVPKFTNPSKKLNKARTLKYEIARKPDKSLNDSFFVMVTKFNYTQNLLREKIKLSRDLYDSIIVLNKEILPFISRSSTNICQVQMEYFIWELNDMNLLLTHIRKSQQPDTNDIKALSEMVNDFFALSSFKTRMKHTQTGLYNRLPQYDYPLLAAYYPDENRKTGFNTKPDSLDVDLSNPANANVYVFINESEFPEMDSYDVFYAPNGNKYSLKKPDCRTAADTLRYFAPLSAVNRASTLPVVLGKGSYCIALRDKNTGLLYVKPDINLVNEKIYDKNNLVRLAFHVKK